jgi:hypothetical protein
MIALDLWLSEAATSSAEMGHEQRAWMYKVALVSGSSESAFKLTQWL